MFDWKKRDQFEAILIDWNSSVLSAGIKVKTLIIGA
jgi:hypothetical protein